MPAGLFASIPSGGLRWHWRAWRSQADWAPTCRQVAAWLDTAPPGYDELLLLGPSAGWMLPSAWLARFSSLDIWDLDPLARPLFAARHGPALRAAGVRWRYQTGDALASLPQLLAAHPQALVLCDNLLGQLRFHQRVPGAAGVTAVEQQIKGLLQTLQGRAWGSVHDVLSGPGQALAQVPAMRARRLKAGDSPAQDAWLQALRPQGDWLDHLTGQVFEPGHWVHDLAWPFEAGEPGELAYWHWLQAGWVQPPGASTSIKP